ncbi:uncharacterized protein LOC131949693 [Physella acuta]|uniref:uncharacterized protein LOC131949693 n=1 Tax=Physella acuta TaxID=109671 RepID=UPI0027DE3511|nr:uncharacterized protein LOC131949693 [Physella acuta]
MTSPVMEYIKVEGSLILPAKVDGPPDVFQCPYFTLVKPSWVPDESSSYCELCSTRFTQLKRRHHCRMCGAVRCAKCCNEKVPLPQLGIEEAERVCESCKTVTELVTKSRSSIKAYLTDSAKGLAAFSRHDKHIKKLIELGGMQALIVLASTDNITVLGHVASGIQSLSTHTSLHKHLAEAGAIKAICKILSTVGDKNQQIAVDCINALRIFCNTPNLKTKALDDGGLQPVLNLCWSRDDTVALLSISTLSLIAEHLGTHAAIVDSKHNAVSRLLQLTASADEQMQEVALKTLAILSTGTHQHRLRLIREDASSDRRLSKLLDSNPNNPQILCNAACLVANLAIASEEQGYLQELLYSCCKRLSTADHNTELLCHLTRALANFAVYKSNTNHLIQAVPEIVQLCLKSSTAPVQVQSMRLLLILLGHAPSRMASLLTSEGGHTFLTNLGELPGFLDTVQNSLTTEAPGIARPL